MITLSPFKRRLVYVSVFEIFAIIFSTLILMVLSNSGADESWPVAVMVSVTAVVWNYVYNSLFEAWERRQQIMQRTFRVRTIHASGFEIGLIVFCLPIYMLWYKVGVREAFMMEITLLLFFLVYTFLFTLGFDKIFTLPQHQSTPSQTAETLNDSPT